VKAAVASISHPKNSSQAKLPVRDDLDCAVFAADQSGFHATERFSPASEEAAVMRPI